MNAQHHGCHGSVLKPVPPRLSLNSFIFLILILIFILIPTTHAQTTPSAPIINAAPEQKLILPKIPDGGIPPALGVQNIQVFRATTNLENAQDDYGWTYNHHVDMAIFRGKYLLAFTNGQKDEDTWPAHELYTTSSDGLHWTTPNELFPQGVSTSLRMYFYHAKNNRLLAIAGLRTGTEKLDEATKGGIVVREIYADLNPGQPYTLRPAPKDTAFKPVPAFDTSADKDFVAACNELLANHTFLEQQDMGTLLGNDRMAIYQQANRNFGKALNFFRRKDGTLVGIAKGGFTTLSTDEGKTWSAPVIPPTLLTNNAKVWTQKTADDRFAMIYNPTARDRFPLVITTSDDGITFDTMRVVHGEVPLQRYPGLNKNLGAQYIRGTSIFANDGSRDNDRSLLVAYSSNKEDIWVSRIPLPVTPAETRPVTEDFSKSLPPGFIFIGWNIYSPKWAPVSIVKNPAGANNMSRALQLQDADPYDYARATRLFPESKKITVQLTLQSNIAPLGELDIELSPSLGTARPIQIALKDDKKLHIASPKPDVRLSIDLPDPAESRRYTLTADIAAGTFTLDTGRGISTFTFAEPADSLSQLTLRTGPHRPLPDPATTPVSDDKPIPPSTFLISDVNIH